MRSRCCEMPASQRKHADDPERVILLHWTNLNIMSRCQFQLSTGFITTLLATLLNPIDAFNGLTELVVS